MILKSLEVENFRKFRAPLRIEGFEGGLNIVVEPNETGKSTLLEALRAVFFIRHSAKTELVRSYVPIGDDVAPRVTVDFVVAGREWSLEKQFMRSHSVRLTGDGRRRESDAAEEALQQLLGFERGNNRGSDPETRGPLGLLWVEQAKALEVESPNRLVRDTVRGVLEAEVGAVTGGRRFDTIRASVESAYGMLRTPSTGRPKGPLAAAEARVEAASAAFQDAQAALHGYEQAMTDLETARARLRIVERDLEDPAVAEERRRLEKERRLAETVLLRRVASAAEHGRAEAIAATAAKRLERLDAAERRALEVETALATQQGVKDEAQSAADAAAEEERELRTALEGARRAHEASEAKLGAARANAQRFAAAAGARRALDAKRALAGLEERERVLRAEASAIVDQAGLDELARLERQEISARARFEAGSVRVELDLAEGIVLRIDGQPSDSAAVDVLAATTFEIGDAGRLLVRPPHGSGRSLGAELAAAGDALAAKLRVLGLESHAAGVARNERATSAARELQAVRHQIEAACPGDPSIGLAPGADAFRAFAAELREADLSVEPPTEDLDALQKAVNAARLAEAAAAARHDDARTALATAEKALATAVADLAAAIRDRDAAAETLEAALAGGDRAILQALDREARRDKIEKLEALEIAQADADAFDLEVIERRIGNLDRAAGRAAQDRLEITGRIARLETTLAREGTAGPAGRVAEAREEEIAAIAVLERLRSEADILALLRQTLGEAADEASRIFLAPVTRRAGRYIEQLLPGCELSFDEELGLVGVTRSGMEERCGDLSRGTQEQLAILTRLAFADLLLENGAPISLILDDPLVYSDDARLETMTHILQEVSKRMQVVLLTCRSKAFRHVEGNRIMIA